MERLNLTPNANEEFAKRAEEYIFYDDIPSSEEEVIQRAKDADGILVNITTQITANIIQHCPNLRYIGMCCSLYDENSASVDIRCARERGITVLGVRDYGDIGVGEYVISQLTDLLHGFHGKRWGDRPLELTGIPVGIIGMGATGQVVARALRFSEQMSPITAAAISLKLKQKASLICLWMNCSKKHLCLHLFK